MNYEDIIQVQEKRDAKEAAVVKGKQGWSILIKNTSGSEG